MEERQKRGREGRKEERKYITRSPYYEINIDTDKVAGAIREKCRSK
jgi:DNA invertase Pin-like site-specific DNA recombinase